MQIGLPRKRGKNKKRFVTPVQIPVKVPDRIEVPVEIEHPNKAANAN